MSLAAIILAAGASSRMGRPKPLLRYEGETFLDRLIGAFSERFAPILVVLGCRAEEIRGACARGSQAEFIVNAGWPLGMLSSLQRGLSSLPRDIEGFAFTPVDSPRISPATLGLLAAEFTARRPQLVIPHYSGRRGHPVICAAGLIPEFLALPPEGKARDVVHHHIEAASFLDVNDPGVVDDIDDAETYRKLTESIEAK